MKIAIVMCIAAMLAGCVQAPLPPGEFEQAALPFLKDGKTTREEVLLKLGEPSNQFESQRILTYRMYRDDDGKTGVSRKEAFIADPQRPNWLGPLYSLVLVFDGTVLARHGVVAVK